MTFRVWGRWGLVAQSAIPEPSTFRRVETSEGWGERVREMWAVAYFVHKKMGEDRNDTKN
jgi:hypothetical protein